MQTDGKVALVTGSAHRVGRAIALALGEAGCNLAIHYHSAQSEAAQTVTELQHMQRTAVAFQADLSKPGSIQDLVERTQQHFGHLDILVQSASILKASDLFNVDEQTYDRIMDVNLKSCFFGIQAAAPLMQAQGGTIINIVDVSALQPWPQFVLQSMSKSALEMLTRLAALQLAPAIRVNAIAPGPVLKPASMSATRWQDMASELPLQRAGSPLDVARTVLFLIRNDFITGETIFVDGGDHLR